MDKYKTAVEWVVNCVQFYATVTAYLETSAAFKENLALIYGYMSSHSYDVVQAAYAELFYESWDKYAKFDKENLSNKQVAEMLLQEFSWDGGKKIIDVFGSEWLEVAQKWVVSATGMSAAELGASALGKAFAGIEAYKAGWWFSEQITKNGEIVDCRELLRANYYLAKGAHETISYRESNLQKSQNYESAERFDSAWGILKDCEEYSLSTYQTYLEKNNSVWYKAWLNHGKTSSEIESIAEWLTLWENASCHNSSLSSNNRIKTVAVCCPTDVYVYDKNGNLVASVENNEVTYREYGIAVAAADDAKVIGLLNPEKYDIKIAATGNGTMSITETTSTSNGDLCSQTKYQDVSIRTETQYSLNYVQGRDAGTLTDGTSTIAPTTQTTNPDETTLSREQSPFPDVQDPGKYYYTPVLWAAANNITNGVEGGLFAPGNTCKREQVVTFLWRAMGSPEPTSTDCPFEDVAEGKYYYKAVLWAVENGITTGKSATRFAPKDTITRAEFVTFLWRTEGKPGYSTSNPFYDVSSGSYYYDAVLWASENGVTTGKSTESFAPKDPCTRGQVVTFLYRDLG